MGAEQDRAMMRRAIALAAARLGQTGDNPAVGCVIAKGGQVLAEAATAPGGRPHAEEQALAIAGEAARGAVAYVTLEPCAERSNGAASCSARLIEAGVSRVVFAADNPDRRSAGAGPAQLSDTAIATDPAFLAAEAAFLYEKFKRGLG
jgi:diaminohydroxyphosphoribosylaminopyrimidine deaminase / 5-amino-6-(5-phosphoribosylamino)uracil reductase